jgi:hypothetical protein
MARAQGARAFETTYGPPPLSGYTKMPFASTTLGAEQPLQTSELLGYGRDPQAPIKDAVTADGDVVIPIDAAAFCLWLKAAFGAPTTTGAEAPYSHEFRSGNWALPSFSVETIATSSAAGTPANIALKRFGHFNGSITRNGAISGTSSRPIWPMPTISTVSKQSVPMARSAVQTRLSRRSPAMSSCALLIRRW